MSDSTTFEATIRMSNGTRFPIYVELTNPTVLQLKRAISELQNEYPVGCQRLVYKGRVLEDERSVSDYNIATKSTLFLVKGSSKSTQTNPPAAPAATATASSVAPSTPAASQPFSPSVPPAFSSSSSSTNPWGIPSPASGSNSGNPFGGMPSTPQEMEQMMNHPMMQSFMNNPELMQNMLQMQMQTNPQLREMLDRNPHLRHLLEDPQVMRQAMEQMRNPHTRQQAMRNHDLALGQLENTPGGFAALSSMYRDFQEPLEEALTGSDNPSSSEATSSTANSNAGASGTAMPNPWSTSSGSSSAATSQSASTNTANGPGSSPFSMDPSQLSSLVGGMGNGGNNNPLGGDPQAMLSLLENPMVNTAMQNMMNENPELIRNMVSAQNPMLAQLFQTNPEMADQMMRQAMDPRTMRAALEMQQAMGGTPGAGGFGVGGGAPPAPGLDFSSILGGGNSGATGNPWATPFTAPAGTGTGGSNTWTAPTQNVAPADRYRSQLRSLYDMGFDNEQQCLAVLEMFGGNLNRAVDHLLTTPSVPAPPSSNNEHQGEGNTDDSKEAKD